MSSPPPTRTVSTLLCHAHVAMALDCLGSLLRHCAEPLSLRLHDDGTLTREDQDLLAERLGVVEFVIRRDADERLSDEFGRYRNILALRRTFPLALKAFDAVLYCSEPVFGYADADVLFLRRFASPFHLPESGERAIFLRDRAPSYSLRSWQKLLSPAVQLPGQINTGLIVVERDTVDLDLMEWFVAEPRHGAIGQMLEQTFWAMLGARIGCRVFDPTQARVMRQGDEVGELVVGHFTARTRHLLPSFVKRSEAVDPRSERVALRTVDAGTCTAWDLFGYEVRRAAQRVVGK